MGRPKLDPDFVAARLVKARDSARRINRKTPQYVYAAATPSGRVQIRYEPPGGPKVVLRSPYPSIAFDAELLALRQGHQPASPHPKRPPRSVKQVQGEVKTWKWLCEAYMRSRKFGQHTLRYQRVQRGVLARTWDEPLRSDGENDLRFGDMPLPNFRTQAIKTLRDRFARSDITPDPMYPADRSKDRIRPSTPEAANSAVKYIRNVLSWALEELPMLIGERNWARDVAYLGSSSARKAGIDSDSAPNYERGHRTWGPEQCDIYERAYPQGTRERLIYDVALYTGQRRGDLARLGHHMIYTQNGHQYLRCWQAKGRDSSPVTAHVPIIPQLQNALDAAARNGVLGDETYIATTTGRPYTAESLANLFRDSCKTVGLDGYSLHGLRKATVVRLIHLDCTIHEIMAITGHRSPKEIERYGREYMRATAAASVLDRWLARNTTTNA